MPDHLGDDMRKIRNEEKEEEIKCLYSVSKQNHLEAQDLSFNVLL